MIPFPVYQYYNVPMYHYLRSSSLYSLWNVPIFFFFFALWTKALLNFFFLVIMKSSKNLTESVICFLNRGCYSGLRTFHHYRRICNMVLDGWCSVNNGKYQVWIKSVKRRFRCEEANYLTKICLTSNRISWRFQCKDLFGVCIRKRDHIMRDKISKHFICSFFDV